MSEVSAAGVSVASEIVSGSPASKPANPAPVVQPNPAPETKPDPMASRFAALARKEKQVREQEAKIKAEAGQYKPMQDLAARAKSDPMSVMKEFGLSLDDLIIASMGESTPAPTPEMQIAEIKAQLQKDKDDAVNAEQDRLAAEEKGKQDSIDEAILNHKLSITDHISKNAEKYELIQLHEAEELVWDVTEAHYEAHGTVLTPAEATDKVEAYLEEQTRKAMSLNRFKPAEPKKDAGFEGYQVRDNQPIKTPSQTLTSNVSTTPADKSSTGRLSVEESKRQAAALLRWT